MGGSLSFSLADDDEEDEDEEEVGVEGGLRPVDVVDTAVVLLSAMV